VEGDPDGEAVLEAVRDAAADPGIERAAAPVERRGGVSWERIRDKRLLAGGK